MGSDGAKKGVKMTTEAEGSSLADLEYPLPLSRVWGELRSLLAQPLTREVFLEIWELLGKVSLGLSVDSDSDLDSGSSSSADNVGSGVLKELIEYARVSLDQQTAAQRMQEILSEENCYESYFIRTCPTENYVNLSDPRSVLLTELSITRHRPGPHDEREGLGNLVDLDLGNLGLDLGLGSLGDLKLSRDMLQKESSLRVLNLYLSARRTRFRGNPKPSLLRIRDLWDILGLCPYFANIEEFTLTAADSHITLHALHDRNLLELGIPLRQTSHFQKLKGLTFRARNLQSVTLYDLLKSLRPNQNPNQNPSISAIADEGLLWETGQDGGVTASLDGSESESVGVSPLEYLCLWGNSNAEAERPDVMSSVSEGVSEGDAFCYAIARSPWLKNLQHLNVGSCGVTARGVEALALAPHLQNLKSLVIAYNDVEGHIQKPLFSDPSVLDTLRYRDVTWDE